jgi:hypothetical protein
MAWAHYPTRLPPHLRRAWRHATDWGRLARHSVPGDQDGRGRRRTEPAAERCVRPAAAHRPRPQHDLAAQRSPGATGPVRFHRRHPVLLVDAYPSHGDDPRTGRRIASCWANLSGRADELPAGLPGPVATDLERHVEQGHRLQRPGHPQPARIDGAEADRAHQLEDGRLGVRAVAGDEAVQRHAVHRRVAGSARGAAKAVQ